MGNTNPVKLGRCFLFFNDWNGFVHGGDRKSSEKVFNLISSDEPKTQKEFAESYGITQQTVNNYMRIANMIPELEDLVDARVKIAPLKIRRAEFYLQLIYSISKSSSNVILKLGNITSCKSSLFCSVTVL